MTITAETEVTIDASSWDFDTYACLLDANNNTLKYNDNSGPGNNARFSYNVTSPGTYYLEVTSAPGTNGSGTYTLSAQAAFAKAKPAKVGTKTQGSLVGFGADAEADCYPYSPAIRYSFKIMTPGVYTIDVGSSAFNAYTCVLDANFNQIAYNDNSGPGSDARIIHNFGTGTYYLEVLAAPGTSGTGIFTYQIYSGYPKPNATMKLGQTAAKKLVSSMAEANCYPYAPAFRIQFKMTTAGVVTIDVSSTAFDPYACLLDSNLNQIAYDNNSGPSSAARIIKTLDVGTYNLQVMAAPGTTGSGTFTASIYPGYPKPDLVMNLGQVSTVNLSSNMAEANCYPYSPAYRIQFTMTAAGVVTIDVGSTVFNAYACVLDANLNQRAYNNNSGPGSNARITTTLDVGSYYLEVMTAPGTVGSGAFTASLQPGYPPGTKIAGRGQTLSGTLTGNEAESVCYPYTPTKRYQFTSTGNQTVTILASSTAFNTYLNLEGANNNCIAYDDNSGGGTNAKITKTLSAGTFYIEVVAAPGTNGTGGFSLSVNRMG